MCIIFGEGCMFKYCVSNKKMYYKIIVLNAIIDLIYLNCLYIPSDINYNNFKIQFLLKKMLESIITLYNRMMWLIIVCFITCIIDFHFSFIFVPHIR